ncbi:MAG TPA: BatD family protein [Polyangia bacterium]|nr:BatD family protein [Polyangia bacterium]
MPVRSLRLSALAIVAGLVLAAPARAAGPTMTIELDRDAVAPGDAFVCEVTLTVGNEEVESYHAPEFKGLRILSTPQVPNRSTQMSMGGGGTFIQNSYSWRYELTVPPGSKGPFVIAGARARVAGRDVKADALTVRVGASAGAGRQTAPNGMPPGFPFDLLGGGRPQAEPPQSTGGSFLRATADKTRVYVGEPVVVTWSLYTTQRLDKFETTTEARTDGFWSEDVPSTAPKGRLAYTQETLNGRVYQVAPLTQRALFPLRDGKLTVTPMEADVAQVDFFGSAVRAQHLKTEPLTIEVVPLPREGRPAGVDDASVAVGKLALAVHADRTTVSVGEAVTVTVEVRGTGNVRNAKTPALPTPQGWKAYPPKENVALDFANGVGGVKTSEALLLPEKPGTVMIPALELVTFDPETKRYATSKSDPLRLDVTGDANVGAAAHTPGAAPGGPVVENVLGAALRPIRARSRLSRDVGTTFLRSRAFVWLLFLPPFALALTSIVERVRGRLAADSNRTRRRDMRRLVRKRLGAAEAHREAGRAGDFYIEIDRVLRDVLAARLGHGVTGLRRDELQQVLATRGLPAELTSRVLAELEACDQARFAPGGATEAAAAMAAALERADELIGAVEKAPLREEASS